MANIKISQLTPKGANLEATDLLEISEFNGSGYETKSITGQEIIDAASGGGAAVNPTSGTIPINNGGVFVDSNLSVYETQNNIRQIQPSNFANKIGIFTDANDGLAMLPGQSGLQFGVMNLNEEFVSSGIFLDCSIITMQAPDGSFGSGIAIKGQKSVSFVPSNVDTQVHLFSVQPFSVFTQTGGVNVYGANILESTSYFNVIGDNSHPSFYKSDYSCARFDGQMTAIVVPKVPTINQSMMNVENGMILYNSTTNKFQGYAAGAWVNLH